MQCLRWYVLRPETTTSSCPSTPQITNLIKYRVATGVTLTYNTTNIPHEIFFKKFIYIIPCNETAETFLFFCYFTVNTTAPCFVPSNPNDKFIPITLLFLNILLPYFVIKIHYEMHIIYTWFISNTNSRNVSKVTFLMFGRFICIFLHFAHANAVLEMQ